jgi:hypothetical protein
MPNGLNCNQGDFNDGIHTIEVAAFNTIAQLGQSQVLVCHTIAQFETNHKSVSHFIIDGDDVSCSHFFTNGA